MENPKVQDKIATLLTTEFPNISIEKIENAHPFGFYVPCEQIKKVIAFLYENPHTYFDFLSCLSVVDFAKDNDEMEIAYVLSSIPFDTQLTLQIKVKKDNLKVPSIASIYKSADWHEREAYDMYGVIFENHPNLRRILMPSDWEGFPLRKDYQESSTYHGMQILHPDSLSKNS